MPPASAAFVSSSTATSSTWRHPSTAQLFQLTLLIANTAVSWNRRRISNIAGTASFTVWLFAQSPQLYENYRRKSVSGLSLVFLTQWIVADVLNLVGAFLTQQLPFQIAVAFYFCCVDCVIVFQWIRYSQINPPPKLSRPKYERHRTRHASHIHHRTHTQMSSASSHKYRPTMTQSLTLTRPSQSPVISSGPAGPPGYASMESTRPVDQQSRRAQSYPGRPMERASSDAGKNIIARLAGTHGEQSERQGRAGQREHKRPESQAEAERRDEAILSARARSRSKASLAMTAGTASTASSRAASPNPSSRGGPSAGPSRSVSPARGRSQRTNDPQEWQTSQHQHPHHHQALSLRPSASRSPSSSSSYKLMTQEALRVALLAERLEERRSRRGRSRSSTANTDTDGYFVGKYDNFGLRMAGSREGSRGSSRRSSIDGQSDGLRSNKGKARQHFLTVPTTDEDDSEEGGTSGLTIMMEGEATARPSPEGSTSPPRRHKLKRHASALGKELDPLLPLADKRRSSRRAGRSRVHSATQEQSTGSGRSKSRKRKATSAVAGVFSLLGIGSLVGLGEVGDSVGFWAMPGTANASVVRPMREQQEVRWRHPVMLYPQSTGQRTGLGAERPDVVALHFVSGNRDDDDHRHHRHNPPPTTPLPPPDPSPPPHDERPPGGGPPPRAPIDVPLLIGRIASWLCTILYTTSRLPQLYLNARRRSVEGLSILLFMSAFMGNSLYSLSILSSPEAVGEGKREYLRESMPFLLGSGGTLVFDAVIVLQWWMWGKKGQGQRRQESDGVVERVPA
ncbi:hypothetical protein BCV69DRAFT_272767 [Microstroma glucosiphilum]|uniref:PQ-loop-domain-containing protein n=1 Tax=Pseudomicrostroma glucosiphilum TaxID=1684307 RepID=A0A316U253_9BASI|nr:hypothetical protein BCV69DRAFT_272767 [Pseudomicrostroma glucosiphilum]PWN18898.1 hypothetical protein BCV69DRAFT_272767 [Pseudomicrostroma glucosiphilum]